MVIYPVTESTEEKDTINNTWGDVTGDDSQRGFWAQHSVATLLRHCFE